MKKTKLSLALLLVSLTGCVIPIADFPLVSMTETSLPPGQKLTSMGPVEAEYCPGDKAQAKSGDVAGLMDEVILQAQSKKKGARFIQDAHFGMKSSCMVLQGTAVK